MHGMLGPGLAYLELLMCFLHGLAASFAFPDVVVTPERLKRIAIKEEEAPSCIARAFADVGNEQLDGSDTATSQACSAP